jgi:uroporphyrinogen-III synthase
MPLLVTRPQPQADEWVQALAARGVPAQALPLIDIAPPADAAAAQAWNRIDRFALLVFVSPNAVASFFALKPSTARWPASCRAGATGPGTSRALREASVPESLIVEPASDAAQFDSEALWQRLRGELWSQRQVLIVRGDGGRDWLADQLRAHGAELSFVQAYRRGVPQFDAAQQRLLAAALQAPADSLWLFSSSQAIDHLRQLAPDAAWQSAHALATHPRIADTARAAGFGAVSLVSPDIDAVKAAWMRSLQSSASSAQRP